MKLDKRLEEILSDHASTMSWWLDGTIDSKTFDKDLNKHVATLKALFKELCEGVIGENRSIWSYFLINEGMSQNEEARFGEGYNQAKKEQRERLEKLLK